MTYWKLGTRWGSWKPDFFPLLKKRSLVICSNKKMKAGDIVAIADGFKVKALALLKSNPRSVEQQEELQNDFKKYQIATFDDKTGGWNHVADAEIWELEEGERFDYATRQGMVKIWLEGARKYLTTLLNEKTKMDAYKLLLESNHNLILTGAPGTGKTHTAREIANAMDAAWELVQFHPSYDYTDFVEGLRPVDNNGQITFERKDGIFKKFCKEALSYEKNWPNLALAALRNDIRESAGGQIELDDNGVKKGLSIQEDSGSLLLDGSSLEDRDILAALSGAEKDLNQPLALITDYIKSKYPKKPFVFIIDEINRGEISKIFGELFYSVDPGYRGKKGKVSTQYQNLVPPEDEFQDGFFVPDNVYIIGTMNDIDRSVESMDFAMRRRFAWRDVSASESQGMLDSDEAWQEHGRKPEQAAIDEIKKRMDHLNLAIIDKYKKDESALPGIGLTPAYQIGAAYFLKYAHCQNFEELWKYHLDGLLREYLRGQPQIEEKLALLKQAYDDVK